MHFSGLAGTSIIFVGEIISKQITRGVRGQASPASCQSQLESSGNDRICIVNQARV